MAVSIHLFICHKETRAPNPPLAGKWRANEVEDEKKLRRWKSAQGGSKLFKVRRAIKCKAQAAFPHFPGKHPIVFNDAQATAPMCTGRLLGLEV
jgi:hypothetical protein